MTFPLLTTGAANSLLFGVYGNHLRDLQKQVKDRDDRRNALPRHVFIAGSVAGFVQAFIACPIELVKIRMQARTCDTTGSWQCVKRILATEGLSGMYRGLGVTICRDVFPHGIYMLSYELVLNFAGKLDYVQELRAQNRAQNVSNINNTLEITLTTLSGSIAGILSWIFVIPCDVVKTVMQAELDPKRYKNMIKCTKHIVKVSGN